MANQLLSEFKDQESTVQFMIYLGTTFTFMAFILIFGLIWENQTMIIRLEKLEKAEKLQLLSNEGLSGLIRNIQETMPHAGDIITMHKLYQQTMAEHTKEICAIRERIDFITNTVEEETSVLRSNFNNICRETETNSGKNMLKMNALKEDVQSLAERLERVFNDLEQQKKVNKYNQETLLENQDSLLATLETLDKKMSETYNKNN